MVRVSIVASIVLLLGFAGAVQVVGQDDDLRTLLKLAENKAASLKEAKAIFERPTSGNAKNVISYAYALVLMQNRRFAEADEILSPFVEKYPRQFLARQLLLRSLIERKRFDLVAPQVDLLIKNLPEDSRQQRDIAFMIGTVVGFMKVPMKAECKPIQLAAVETVVTDLLPDELRASYELGIEHIQRQVDEFEAEIVEILKSHDEKLSKLAEKAEEQAEKTKEALDEEKEEMAERDKNREVTLENLSQMVSKVQRDHSLAQSQLESLMFEHSDLERQIADLYELEIIRDENGRIISRQRVIRNFSLYERLTDRMGRIRQDASRLEFRVREAQRAYDRLRSDASKVMNDKQRDQFFTANRLAEGKKDASKLEARANRLNEEANKQPAAVRAIRVRMQFYSTYFDIPIATYQDYLSEIGKKVATKSAGVP